MLESGGHGFHVKRRREEFKCATGRYESVGPSSDNDRAYELASALGREASLLAGRGGLSSGESAATDYFSWLSAGHRRLLDKYPETLIDKQEVVQISLAALSTLYNIYNIDKAPGSERLERLDSHIRRGVTGALQRENAIFFIQMMVVAAVVARARGEEITAFRTACCAAGALRRSGLNLDHEGVSLLAGYLNVAEPVLATVVQSVFDLDAVDGVDRVISMGCDLSSAQAGALIRAADESSEWLNQTRGLSDVFDFDVQSMI